MYKENIMKSINDLYETTPSHKQDIQFLQEVAECLSQRIRRIPLLIQALGENQVVSKKTIDEYSERDILIFNDLIEVLYMLRKTRVTLKNHPMLLTLFCNIFETRELDATAGIEKLDLSIASSPIMSGKIIIPDDNNDILEYKLFIELSVGDPDRLSDIGSLRITIQDQVTSHKTLFDGVVFIDEKLRAVEPSMEELSKSIMSALEAAKD